MVVKELTRNQVSESAARNRLPVNVGVSPGADELLEVVCRAGSLHLTVLLSLETEECGECLCKHVKGLSPVSLALLGGLNRRHVLANKVTLGRIVKPRSHNAENEGLVEFVLVLHVQEHKGPEVLPGTHYRQEPCVMPEDVGLVVSDPKDTLERLIPQTGTLLNSLGLLVLADLYLSGDKAEIERETDCGFRVLTPQLRLLSKHSVDRTPNGSACVSELVNDGLSGR